MIDGDRQEATMRILIVCGAGASSTFVAVRLRRAAAARGLEVQAVATSETGLASALPGSDVLLVGAHLSDRLPAIRDLATAESVPVATLPESAAAGDGSATLDLALEFAGARP
ncbi:hypothetical protein ABIQ69_04355 [Agromyces sp. G08B096]|uniref:PTS EIIB type-3 domain-containing protein n=1 Tax=Agromyces sp. G08B096 TaxID=3156399 RepID=A0AAU7W8H1_9MICO